jgi:hypothetical protein
MRIHLAHSPNQSSRNSSRCVSLSLPTVTRDWRGPSRCLHAATADSWSFGGLIAAFLHQQHLLPLLLQGREIKQLRVPGWAWTEVAEPRVVPLATNALYYLFLVVRPEGWSGFQCICRVQWQQRQWLKACTGGVGATQDKTQEGSCRAHLSSPAPCTLTLFLYIYYVVTLSDGQEAAGDLIARFRGPHPPPSNTRPSPNTLQLTLCS